MSSEIFIQIVKRAETQLQMYKCEGSKVLQFSLEGGKQSQIGGFSPERLPEHVHAPPSHSREEARPKVSGRVDGVAAVQAHGHSDGHDDQADAQRLHSFWGADILLVSDGQDAQDECTGSNYLEKHEGGYSILQILFHNICPLLLLGSSAAVTSALR